MKKRKTIITIASVAAAVALAVGGVLAYLQDVTPWYSNTFEFPEGLEVTLEDEATTYKVVPGKTQAKNTSVTLSNEDVPAYLYVVVKEENTTIGGKEIVEWDIADGWTELAYAEPDIGWDALLPADADIQAGNTKIFYRTVDASAEESEFAVLSGNQVRYPLGLTKEDIPAGTEVHLNFAARAIQQEGFSSAAKAWIGEEEEIPAANFNLVDPATVGTVTSATDNWTGELDTAVAFSATETPEELAEKTYGDWVCDFSLSFNQDVDQSKVRIFGQYDAFGSDWVGGPLGSGTLPADTEVNVIADWLSQAISGVSVSYSDVVNLGTFNCGVAVEDAPAGLVASLDLVMTDGEGNAHIISSQTIPIN